METKTIEERLSEEVDFGDLLEVTLSEIASFSVESKKRKG